MSFFFAWCVTKNLKLDPTVSKIDSPNASSCLKNRLLQKLWGRCLVTLGAGGLWKKTFIPLVQDLNPQHRGRSKFLKRLHCR